MKQVYQGERIVGFSELKGLFFALFPKMKRIFLIAFLVAVGFILIQPVQFKAKASFRTAGQMQERTIPYKELFIGAGFSPKEAVSLPVMESDALLGDVVKKLGLQISLSQGSRLKRLSRRCLQNVLGELGKKQEDPEKFVFHDITFTEEKPKVFPIKILGPEAIAFLDEKGDVLAEAVCGKEFSVPGLCGKLVTIPQDLSSQRIYSLQAVPLVQVNQKLRTQIKAKRNKQDSNILNLECTYADRHLAAAILNQVMASYEQFLREENAQKMQLQISYLQMRENQLMEEWNNALKDYEGYLQQNLGGSGYLNCAQEIQVLGASQNTFTGKIFDIDLELKRLGFPASETLLSSSKDQKAQKQDLPLNATQLGKEKELWELDIAQQQLGNRASSDAFEELNLDAARALYRECHQQKDALELKQVQYQALLEKMEKNTFDVSALTTILTDPVAQDIVHKAALIAVQLKDSCNRSLREQEQLTESLDVQKRFITSHLENTISLGALQIQVINQKISSLSRMIAGMLGREKGLLEHKMEEIAHEMEGIPERWRKENLLSFKKEIGVSLLEAIASLTESRNMDLNLFQGGVKCLDQGIPPSSPLPKNLFRNSFLFAMMMVFGFYFFQFTQRLQSGFPVSHETLQLLGCNSLGVLSKNMGKTLESLEHSDMGLLRDLSTFLSSYQSSKATCALIVGGKAPNFSKNLSELMAMEGLKVLLVDYLALCPVGKTGLSQYLSGETDQVQIHSEKGFDHIFSGGWERHAPEQIKTPKFLNLLEEMKTRYDRILFYTEAQPRSFGEVSAALGIADLALVTVGGETREDLIPFMRWEDRYTSTRLAFVGYQS